MCKVPIMLIEHHKDRMCFCTATDKMQMILALETVTRSTTFWILREPHESFYAKELTKVVQSYEMNNKTFYPMSIFLTKRSLGRLLNNATTYCCTVECFRWLEVHLWVYMMLHLLVIVLILDNDCAGHSMLQELV